MSKFWIKCLAFVATCAFALAATRPWEAEVDLNSALQTPTKRLEELTQHTLYAATGCAPINEALKFCGGHKGWRGVLMSKGAPFQIFESNGLVLTITSFAIENVATSDPRRMIAHRTAIDQAGGIVMASDPLPMTGLFHRKNTVLFKVLERGFGADGVFEKFSLSVSVGPLNDDKGRQPTIEHLLEALTLIERR